uniref:TSA: Wollemia nobilis Ref_Wollemi_Transcript_7531_1122 transcribed RNA sequence n=1 Tax=Wollemia nobilis TaxID=56998 RepID=A0A0C9RNV3_9CONI
MADSPRRRYSSSPSPRRVHSRSRSRSPARQHRGTDDAHNPGNTLYVTGLSTRVTEKHLEEHFSREGKVVDCRLVVEPRTRISRGFGFVTMNNVEDAERCVKYLNQSILEGRYITVEKSRRKRPRTPTPGNYLGVKSTREAGSYYERDRRRSHYGRDGYASRRSPRRSPYYDGRGYSPRRSPIRGGGSRRERTRSPPYSPYGSPVRSRGHRSYSERSR